jgi:arsenite methyltransferase
MTASYNQVSINKYRSRANGYDASAQHTMPLRRKTVDLLRLRAGDVVLDVGAGTGLSYELLLNAVGASGRVLACEQSPQMFAQAQARCEALRGGHQVWQQCVSAEEVVLPQAADAVLFNYVHDVLRAPLAVANIMRQLKPGARVAIAGMKFFPWWTGPLNLLAWAKNRPYNARATDMWAPWDIIESYCTQLQRQSTQCGMGYVAHGRVKDDI